MQTLSLGSQRCADFCSLRGPAGSPSLGRPSVLPWALEPACPASQGVTVPSPHPKRLPSLPSLLERR